MPRQSSHGCKPILRQTPVIFGLLVLFAGLVGCAGTRGSQSVLAPVDDPTIRVDARAEAVSEIWQRSDRPTRQSLIDLYWSSGMPGEVRIAILRTLAADDEARSTARRMIEVGLPLEADGTVIEAACALAVEHGWRDLAGPMVRSLSRKGSRDTVRQRPEAIALGELFPQQSLEASIFAVVTDPGQRSAEDSPGALDLNDRTRLDAWELLGLLDSDGTTRLRLVRNLPSTDRSGLIADLAAAEAELGVLPMTAMEVDWLRTMRADSSWWADARRVMASLDRSLAGPMQLRHVEPIRWASANEPGLLAMTRTELLALLTDRLSGREFVRRTADRLGDGPNRESLGEWSGSLTWGDLVAIAVIERALDGNGVRGNVLRYVGLDRNDTSTEYGGLLVDRGDGFRAELFVPRPSERVGDDAFVASPDLLDASGPAIAHFHLQVQEEQQRRYAGPSGGDVLFASRSGRNAVVFTSVGGRLLNVDFYTPRGEVVDLGVLGRAGWAAAR